LGRTLANNNVVLAAPVYDFLVEVMPRHWQRLTYENPKLCPMTPSPPIDNI